MSKCRNHGRVAGGSVTDDAPDPNSYQRACCLVQQLPTVAIATVNRQDTHVEDGSFKRLPSVLRKDRTEHETDRFTPLGLRELPPIRLLLEVWTRQSKQDGRRPVRPVLGNGQLIRWI
jgi:hypothetical protein